MNRLSMANISAIETLHRSGHSNREIARLLGLSRDAVNKYVARYRAGAGQNRPNPQPGRAAESPPPATHNGPVSRDTILTLIHATQKNSALQRGNHAT